MSRLLVGDETGLVKCVHRDRAAARVAGGSFVQERRRGVRRLALSRRDPAVLHCALACGELEWYALQGDDDEADQWDLVGTSVGLGDCAGLGSIPTTGDVVAVDATEGRVSFSSQDGGRDRGSFETGGNVTAFDCDGSRCVVGGKENELVVWSLETHQKVFRARNVPHDKLNLRVPVWLGALRFVDADVVVAGTMHHQLRLYDMRANRRPVKELAMDQAIKALAVVPNAALVGDVAGGLISVDLRTMRVNARYRGPAGSIRALEAHPTNPHMVAAAGLDRVVHIWDTSKRSMNTVASIYCKQRLTTLAWLPETIVDEIGDLEEEEDDDDDADDEGDHGDDDDDL